jgi:hypothetical protein
MSVRRFALQMGGATFNPYRHDPIVPQYNAGRNEDTNEFSLTIRGP